MTRLVLSLFGLALVVAVPSSAQAPSPQDAKQVEEVLARWAKRSTQHAAVVEVLREKLAHQPATRDFDAIEKEAAFVERLRQATDLGAQIETLEDMAKGVEHEPSRMLLTEAARSKDEALTIQASAVLAISRLGSPKALEALEALGKDHPAEEIRTRAARLAAALRARDK